jgi:hypothetical protein
VVGRCIKLTDFSELIPHHNPTFSSVLLLVI